MGTLCDDSVPKLVLLAVLIGPLVHRAQSVDSRKHEALLRWEEAPGIVDLADVACPSYS